MVGKTFSTLEHNERRRSPWLGSGWFDPEELESGEVKAEMEAKRRERCRQWDEETERMLKANPNLKLVD